MVLGIDIGGNQIRAGMVDEEGAILASRTIPTPADLDTFLPSLQDAIRWLVESTALPAGVGVGCKGLIDPDTTRIESLRGPLHFLQGLRIVDMVGLPLDVPVFADNDARVALAGEMVWGAARGLENVLMLTLGNGVGGAALVNGRLLRGHSGVAGNMGHLTVNPYGAICSCGNRGCLETVFSARAIEADAWAAVHRGCDSVLTQLFREQPQLASCRTVFQAAREGDALARRDCLAGHLQAGCGAGRIAAHLRPRDRDPGRPGGRRGRGSPGPAAGRGVEPFARSAGPRCADRGAAGGRQIGNHRRGGAGDGAAPVSTAGDWAKNRLKATPP